MLVVIVVLILLWIILIFNNFANYLLKRLEPHPKDSPHFSKAMDVAGEVVVAFVANIFDQVLCEAIAISAERIVIASVPKVPHVSQNFINFL